jgi:hypothetical protein
MSIFLAYEVPLDGFQEAEAQPLRSNFHNILCGRGNIDVTSDTPFHTQGLCRASSMHSGRFYVLENPMQIVKAADGVAWMCSLQTVVSTILFDGATCRTACGFCCWTAAAVMHGHGSVASLEGSYLDVARRWRGILGLQRNSKGIPYP